ncbi:MAG TPA: SHOCT domain-containing protein [Bacteroidetes bacterium]|nr:SHOCT domain-containing protein [Bacteroidota bacterium]HEX04382.1 SHOCT domain-containing protein [Bacteroidota bacterium]
MLIGFLLVVYMIVGRGTARPPWGDPRDHYSPDRTETDTALEILKKRYAKGEITKEEFEKMRNDIE